MLLLYTHGLGGTPHAQPEIEEVFKPLGYTVVRVAVPFHQSIAELVTRLATASFGDMCNWVDQGANNLIAAAQQTAPQPYVVVGDSLGGFISLVAAERDPRISHCVLLACSGDFCDAMTRLDQLNPALGLIAGNLSVDGKGGIKAQALSAIAGHSDFQREFDLINTFQPDRLARLCPVLMLGDRRDPVAPESVCLHFAQLARSAAVRMVYDEGRHHAIGKTALERYAVPFLQGLSAPPISSERDRGAPALSAVRNAIARLFRRAASGRPRRPR